MRKLPAAFLACVANAALAQSPSVNPVSKPGIPTEVVLARQAALARKLPDWEADVEHAQTSKALGKTQKSYGSLYFSRPKRFRYSLGEPENSNFISDGRQAWLVRHDKSGKSIMRNFPKLDGVSVAESFFSLLEFPESAGEQERWREIYFLVPAPAADGTITLNPRYSNEIAEIRLRFAEGQGVPREVQVEDALGNVTRVQITNVRGISTVDPARFNPKVR
jgi:outer membrane lipoprotein-sorting protein